MFSSAGHFHIFSMYLRQSNSAEFLQHIQRVIFLETKIFLTQQIKLLLLLCYYFFAFNNQVLKNFRF